MPIAVLTMPSLAVIPASWMLQETIEVVSGAVAPVAIPVQDAWSFALKLWLSGALILLVRLAISQVALIRWRLKARPLPPGAWAETLKYVSHTLANLPNAARARVASGRQSMHLGLLSARPVAPFERRHLERVGASPRSDARAGAHPAQRLPCGDLGAHWPVRSTGTTRSFGSPRASRGNFRNRPATTRCCGLAPWPPTTHPS